MLRYLKCQPQIITLKKQYRQRISGLSKGTIPVALKQNQTRRYTIFWKGDLGFLKVQVTTNGIMHRKFLDGQDRKNKYICI